MTKSTFTLSIAGALMAFAVSCGDDKAGATCGAGTTLTDGVCVADPGTTCGAGTTLVNGECVGSTLTCGPGTVVEGDACVLDTSAPGPVTGLTAVVSGTNINVSWTAGTGSVGTLVARLDAGAAATPVSLHTYAVGDIVPGNATVISVGDAATIADAFTVPGRYSYMAWPINASGKLGFGREVAVAANLGAQTGAVSLDLTNTTATVATQPAQVAITLTDLAFDTDHATVTFAIKNNTAGPLFSPRVVVTNPSVGTIANTTGTTAAGDPFYLVQPGIILPGQSNDITLQVNGVVATDTITADVAILESGVMFTGSNLLASEGGGGFGLELPGVLGGLENCCDTVFTANGVFSPSGRYFYNTSRWGMNLYRIDLANGDVTGLPIVAEGGGSGMLLVRETDGFAYQALHKGAHHAGDGTALVMARIDLASMTTVAVTTLVPEVGPAYAANASFGGHRFALAWGGSVFYFHTDTMTFEDSDAGTTAIDPVATPVVSRIRNIVSSSDGSITYLNESGVADSASEIYKIDAAGAVTTYHTASSAAQGLALDAAGNVWWAAPDGLFKFDGTTETSVPGFTASLSGIVEIGATTAKVIGSGFVETVTLADGTVSEINTKPNTSRQGHRASWFKLY
jgi:sugar lactone lactonase YvrE